MPESQTMTSAREYETIYVLRPDAGRTASENISGRVQDVVSKGHGSLTKVENWGYRKLAYSVRKQTRGVYVYLKYIGDGALVTELERNLRLQDAVLKFQTVKVGDAAQAAAPAPEEVAFEHIEVPEDEEPEESFARSLGLEEPRPEAAATPEGATEAKAEGEGAAAEATPAAEQTAEAPSAGGTAEAADKSE